MKPIVLCDIDGTLADVRHRLHFVTATPKNWKDFFSVMDKDPLYAWCAEILRRFGTDHEIVLLTGRPEEYRDVTEAWLRTHGVRYDRLLMRPRGDNRKDVEAKRELLRKEVDVSRIVFCLEDREPVAEMLREEGCTALVVLGADLGESAPTA